MIVFKEVSVPDYEGERLLKRDVVIENGVYTGIVDSADTVSFKNVKVIPCEGSLLLPAFIDPHVHVREPGFDYKEDWETCSRAALKGGASAIFDMPNNRVPVDNYNALKEKIKIAGSKSYIDFGLYIALTDTNVERLFEPEVQESVCGIKIYISKTTGKIMVNSDEALLKVFNQPKPVLVHTGGRDGLERILYFYKKAEGRFSHLPVLYICHVSEADEIELLKKWKKKYSAIMIEVTPHHLFLNRDEYRGLPGVLPPLAGRKDVDALWEGVRDGTVGILGTDHAPHTVEEKSGENPPSGFPGLETALPLLLTAWKNRRLTLKTLLGLTSGNTGKLYNLSDRTGIRKGLRADCALFREGAFKAGEDGYETKSGWSPFHGEPLAYKTSVTVVNGRALYDHGLFCKAAMKPILIT